MITLLCNQEDKKTRSLYDYNNKINKTDIGKKKRSKRKVRMKQKEPKYIEQSS